MSQSRLDVGVEAPASRAIERAIITMIKRSALHCAIAMLAITTLANSASAGPFLRLRVENVTTGHGVVITDQNAGFDQNAADGAVSWSGTLDGVVLGITVATTGVSKPVLNLNQLDLLNLQAKSTAGAADIWVTLEDAGFAGPGGPLISSFGGTATAGSTATGNGYANAANLVPVLGADQLSPNGPLLVPAGPPAVPAGSVTPGAQGPFTGAFGSVVSTPFVAGGAFSLFVRDHVTFSGANQVVSFDHHLQAVPEAGTVVGFCSLAGMGGFGLLRLRKRNCNAAA